MYCGNNVANCIDPDGTTTLIGSENQVTEVVLNNDCSIWKDCGNFYSYVGDTPRVNEFINPDTGKKFDMMKLNLGNSFDGLIRRLYNEQKSLSLIELAKQSRDNNKYDIMTNFKNKSRMLNGKYVTGKSAGNYLFGLNMSNRLYLAFVDIGAGLYHIYDNGKSGVGDIWENIMEKCLMQGR